MSSLKKANKQHPAVEWALNTDFSPIQVDCTTTVALKILDGKCKMLPGEKEAIFAIYDVVKQLPGELFTQNEHDIVTQARTTEAENVEVMIKIHSLRLHAEIQIAKSDMKAYKKKLRDGLFG